MAKIAYAVIETVVLVPAIIVGGLILCSILGWRTICRYAIYNGDAALQERYRVR